MSGAYLALTAMILCRRYVIKPLSLQSSSQETCSSKTFFPFSYFRRSKSESQPDTMGAPPETFLELFTTSSGNCQSRIGCWSQRPGTTSPSLPLYIQSLFCYVLSNNHVSGTLENSGETLYLGIKRKIGLPCLWPSWHCVWSIIIAASMIMKRMRAS